MKRTHLFLTVFLISILLAFFTNMMAQDSLKIQIKTKTETKTQTQARVKAQTEYGAGTQNQFRFQSKKGEGMDELARDHDGDGIPNGRDEDYDGLKFRAGHGKKGFVDENGDGINDNAEDWDNDGIPNGQDEDFIKSQDGSGKMMQYRHNVSTQTRQSSGFGPGDGTGNKGIGPQDGSGNGPGTGDCPESGTKTRQKNQGNN